MDTLTHNPWIYTHTHSNQVMQWYISWLFQLAPGWASLSSNSTPQPQSSSSPAPSQSPGSAPTPTILSTNCLSISPVPANYQLLMNGSPYRAERPRGEGEGEERAGLRARRGGEESTADCYYLNKLTAPLWYSVCVFVWWRDWRQTAAASAQKSSVEGKITAWSQFLLRRGDLSI